MLTIRLTRKGKKNQPFFRVVLVDKRKSAKSGSAIEILGNVDPLTKKRNFKKDRILYWLSKGAKASPTVHNLFVSEKIVDAKKIHVSKLSKKKQAEMAKTKEEAVAKASASAKASADKKEEAEVKAVEPVPAEVPVAAPEDSGASLAPSGREPVPVETPAEPEKPVEEPPAV